MGGSCTSQLTRVKLKNILTEYHPRNVRVCHIHGLNLTYVLNNMEGCHELVLTIMPYRKRKQQEEVLGMESSSSPALESLSSDNSDGLVVLSSCSLDSLNGDQKIEITAIKWDSLIGNINHLTSLFKNFKHTIYNDVDTVENRVTAVDACIEGLCMDLLSSIALLHGMALSHFKEV